MEFFDDVHTGDCLNKDKVIEARTLEMEYYRKMKVYTKVHKS